MLSGTLCSYSLANDAPLQHLDGYSKVIIIEHTIQRHGMSLSRIVLFYIDLQTGQKHLKN